MNNYIRLLFRTEEPGIAEIIIAALSEIGFEGFEESDNSVSAFIAEKEFDESAVDGFIRKFKLDVQKTLIPAQNWNHEWETHFSPVIIDHFVGIRAEFHPPFTGLAHEIVITPKMSFGTGHHATTSMMIRQMKTIDFKGRQVLDFGTGTGILSILASLLGARQITALDNDAWSITNAVENLHRNNIQNVLLEKANDADRGGQFDIIIANITKNIILENFASFIRQLNKNGILLLSGLLPQDEPDILAESSRNSLSLLTRLEEGNWLSLSFLR